MPVAKHFSSSRQKMYPHPPLIRCTSAIVWMFVAKSLFKAISYLQSCNNGLHYLFTRVKMLHISNSGFKIVNIHIKFQMPTSIDNHHIILKCIQLAPLTPSRRFSSSPYSQVGLNYEISIKRNITFTETFG